MTEVGVGTTTYAYDTAGRLSSITNPFSETTSYTYDTAGRVNRVDYGNGTYDIYVYDSLSRVINMRLWNSFGTLLKNRWYTYDDASQVTQLTDGSRVTNYGYDNAGQLTSESNNQGYSASYTYDGNGNRLTRTVNGVTETYTYDLGDKLTAITGGLDPRTFTYDGAGRTTGIVRGSGTTAFTYDYESRVTSITKPGMTMNTFAYNGLDTRVSKTDSGGTKTFKRDGVGVTAPLLNDGVANYTHGVSSKVGASPSVYSGSGLKNADVQTNSGGTVSASRVYDAFGNAVSSSGAWQGSFGYAGNFGYQEDNDTSLRLLGHRYYDSSTGRFLTRDPIKDGRNWYSYCGGNPINTADPNGLSRITTLYKLVNQSGDVMKFGITYNPKSRYRKWWTDLLGYKLEPLAEYKNRRHALDDERILVQEMGGPLNKEPWSSSKKKGMIPLALSQSEYEHDKEEYLHKYKKRLENDRKVDWGLLQFIPILGDAIDGGEILGDYASKLHYRSRRAHLARQSAALSTD